MRRAAICFFGLGLLVGSLVGGPSNVGATSKTFWDTYGVKFQMGYLAGFFAAADLGRNLEPDGWFDKHYPKWENVKLLEWKATIDRLYEDEEHHDLDARQIIARAGGELRKKHGAPPSHFERNRELLASIFTGIKEREEAFYKANPDKIPVPPTYDELMRRVASKAEAETERLEKRCRKLCGTMLTDQCEFDLDAQRKAIAAKLKKANRAEIEDAAQRAKQEAEDAPSAGTTGG